MCFKALIAQNCLNCIKAWMLCNFLQLTENKTEIVVCISASLVPQVLRNLGSLSCYVLFMLSIRDPGMTVDENQMLRLDLNVKALVCSCFHHQRTIIHFHPTAIALHHI